MTSNLSGPGALIDPEGQLGPILQQILVELRVITAILSAQAPKITDDPDFIRNDKYTAQVYPQQS